MGHLLSGRLLILPAAIAAFGYATWSAANLEVDRSPIRAPAPAQASVPPKPAGAGDAPLRTAEDFPQTVQRPLFFSDRRLPEKPKPKPKPVVAEVKEPVANLEPLVLVGIKRQGDMRQILVRTASELAGTWVSVGEQFRGWQLRDVQTDNAILEGRGRVIEVRLYSPQQPLKQ